MPKKRVGVSLRQSSPPPEATATSSEPSGAIGADIDEPASKLEPVLREALSAQEVKSLDAFVSGAALALEKAATALPAAKLEEMRRRGPEGYRELTVYLPEDLAQKLSMHCLEHDLDLSRLIAAALERHLSVPPAPDAGLPEQLTAAARALLSDLAAWVRTAWATRRRHWPSRAVASS